MSKKEHKAEEAKEKIEQNAEQQQEEQAGNQEVENEVVQSDEDKLQEMGEKLASLNDKYLRLYSEYENYRKRTNTEKADLLLNGGKDVIKAILPIVDDFERAISATGGDEGVVLIYNKMMKVLEQKGLKAMESKGEKFDEALHEAITRIPATDPEQKGLVVDVVEKGYYLNDKVLRYAKVVVAC